MRGVAVELPQDVPVHGDRLPGRHPLLRLRGLHRPPHRPRQRGAQLRGAGLVSAASAAPAAAGLALQLAAPAAGPRAHGAGDGVLQPVPGGPAPRTRVTAAVEPDTQHWQYETKYLDPR